MPTRRFCSGTGTPAEAWLLPHSRSLLGEPGVVTRRSSAPAAPPPQPTWRRGFPFMSVGACFELKTENERPADRTLCPPQQSGPPTWAQGQREPPGSGLKARAPGPAQLAPLRLSGRRPCTPRASRGSSQLPWVSPTHPLGWGDPLPPDVHPGPRVSKLEATAQEQVPGKAESRQSHAPCPRGAAPNLPRAADRAGPSHPRAHPGGLDLPTLDERSPRDTDTPVWALVLRRPRVCGLVTDHKACRVGNATPGPGAGTGSLPRMPRPLPWAAAALGDSPPRAAKCLEN